MNSVEWKEYSVITNKSEEFKVEQGLAEYVMYLEDNLNQIMIESNKRLDMLEHIKKIAENDKITGIEAKLMIQDIVQWLNADGKENK